MPTAFQLVETSFPQPDSKNTEQKIDGIYDYLFILLEQLRYTLFNLDDSNVNQNALSDFIQNISDPIYAKIEDTDKNVNELSVTAQGLAGRLANAEGDITQLGATAQGLQASITNINGSITNLTADINGLRATVSGKIDGTEAQSLINQTINGITLAATSDSGGTVFKLKSGGVEVASTGNIDLHVKSVNIDGDVTAAALIGDTVAIKYRYLDSYLQTVEGIAGYITTNETTTGGGLGIASQAGLRLTAGSGSNVFLASNGGNSGPFITLDYGNGNVQLGGGRLVIGSDMYGNNPPANPVQGTLYFLRKS